MTTDGKLKIVFGFLSIGLLITLLFKLTDLPGGMILSGLFLGGMLLVGILIGCLILTAILTLIFKRNSFLTLLSITATFSFIVFHYSLYSPTLSIKVPKGFNGKIYLVLSNVEENILTVDSNGIGYLNEWTFNKTYTKPIVEEIDGENIQRNLVGFNPSNFWGKGKSCCIDGKEIESMSFEIVPDGKIGQKQYYSKDLTNLVDKKLVLIKN